MLKYLEKLPSSIKDIEDPAALRTAVVGWVLTAGSAGAIERRLGDRISPLCKIVGMDEHHDLLEQLFRNNAVAAPVRELALAAIFHSERGLKLFETLTPEERVEWCGPWVRPMIEMAAAAAVTGEAFPQFALCALLRATPPAARTQLVAKVAEHAAQMGVDLWSEAFEKFRAQLGDDISQLGM